MKESIEAHKRLKQAKEELIEALRKEFPIGSVVHFERWGGFITAEVLDIAPFVSADFFVRNCKTGKEYRIDYRTILESRGVNT